MKKKQEKPRTLGYFRYRPYSYISNKLFYPVIMARSKVAFSSSDLKKMDEEKSSGSDVDNDDNS